MKDRPCAGRNAAFMLTVKLKKNYRFTRSVVLYSNSKLNHCTSRYDWGLVGCAWSKELQAIRLNAYDFTTPSLTLQSYYKRANWKSGPIVVIPQRLVYHNPQVSED